MTEKPRDANDTLREEGAEVLRIQFDAAKRRRDQRSVANIYTASTLRCRQFAPLKQICGDIIVEGLTLLAARPKVGKTWLALDIAIAVATGGYCLGDLKCEQGGVLFLALEDNQRRMQRRLTKLLLGIGQEWPPIAVAHDWPRADQGGLDHIRDWIADAAKPRLIIVDVLARFRKLTPNGKQQNYEADYEAIAALQKIASETGIAILVIHHTRKGEADDPVDMVSGTLGLAAAADAILVIDRKNDGGVRLYGRSRDVDEFDKAMEFDRESCRWTILGENSEVSRSTERKAIIAILKEHGDAMAPKELAAAVDKSVNSVQLLLQRMAKDRAVVKVEYGRYALCEAPSLTECPTEQTE